MAEPINPLELAHLRLDCLKVAQAIERTSGVDNVLACADKLFAWVSQPPTVQTRPVEKAKGK